MAPWMFLVAMATLAPSQMGVFANDPCMDARKYHENWRDVAAGSGVNLGHCDRGLYETGQWYTFLLHGSAAEIPTQCLKSNMCGTTIGMRIELDGKSLPDTPGTSIDAVLCCSYDILGLYDCCVLRVPVTIHRCDRGHFVYRFNDVSPFDRCDMAICAKEVNQDVEESFTAKRGDPHLEFLSTTAGNPEATTTAAVMTPLVEDDETEASVDKDVILQTLPADDDTTTPPNADKTDAVVTTESTSEADLTTDSVDNQGETSEGPLAMMDGTPVPDDQTGSVTTSKDDDPTTAMYDSVTSTSFAPAPVKTATDATVSLSTEAVDDQTPTTQTDASIPGGLPGADTTNTTDASLDIDSNTDDSVTSSPDSASVTSDVTVMTSDTANMTSDASLDTDTIGPVVAFSTLTTGQEDESTTPIVTTAAGSTPPSSPPTVKPPATSSVESDTTEDLTTARPFSTQETMLQTNPSPPVEASSIPPSSSQPTSTPPSETSTPTPYTTTDSKDTSTPQAPQQASSSGPASASVSTAEEQTAAATAPPAAATTTEDGADSDTSVPDQTPQILPLPTDPSQFDEIRVERMRLVFEGNNETMEFSSRVQKTVKNFLRGVKADKEQSGSSKWWFKTSLLSQAKVEDNATTAVVVEVEHASKESISNTFARYGLENYFLEHTGLKLLAYCPRNEQCGRKQTKSSATARNTPILITVLALCCICIVVLLFAILCIRYRRQRGSYVAKEDGDRKSLSGSDTTHPTPLTPGAKESPFTDAQITKDENFMESGAPDGDDTHHMTHEDSWVVPFEDVHLQDGTTTAAKSTEDTPL